jgi:hypothetical protein
MSVDTKITLTDYTPSLATLYLVLKCKQAGTAYNPTAQAWQTYTAAGYAGFAITPTEAPSASGDYEYDVSGIGAPVGTLNWAWKLKAGGSPALSDVTVAYGSQQWDGTTFGPLGQLQSANTTLTDFTKYQISGTVQDTSPTAGGFIVTFANGFSAPQTNKLVGRQLAFTGGGLWPDKQQITGYTFLSGTTARLSFGNPFAGSPANGDPWNIL